MLAFDYEIIDKKAWNNVVVYALSWKFEEDGTLLSLSFPVPYWIEDI